MVTFPFHNVPSKQNTSRAVHRSIPILHVQADQLTCWACLIVLRTRASSFAYGLELILLQCHCLLNFTGTLCCCHSSDLSVFCDRRSTASNFAVVDQSISDRWLIQIASAWSWSQWNGVGRRHSKSIKLGLDFDVDNKCRFWYKYTYALTAHCMPVWPGIALYLIVKQLPYNKSTLVLYTITIYTPNRYLGFPNMFIVYTHTHWVTTIKFHLATKI